MKGAVTIDLLQIRILGRNRQCRRSPQLSYAPPAVAALPSRHQFEDFVDGVVLFLRTEFDASHEELIDGWQQPRIDRRLGSNVLDNARHTQNRAASQSGLHNTNNQRGRNAE